MNIDDLTIKQLKEIQAMMQNTEAKQHPFIGKFVLCRCYSAGVHAGTLKEIEGDKVILGNSRRLWSWKGSGIALSGVANGKLISGKVDTPNPEIYLTGVIEVIPCTKEAQESITCQ